MKYRHIALLFIVAESFSQTATQYLDAGGYIKYLLSQSNIPPYGHRTDHLLHARANLTWYATDVVTAACNIRARGYAGGTVENTPNFADQIRNDHEYARLDVTLWNARTTMGYAEVDRLWVDWNQGPWRATFGRQRAAMGTCLVWNPVDVFNPLSILDFDYEERPAFDGGRVQYYLGALSKIDVVVKPGKTSSTAAAAVTLTANAWEFDFHVMAARRGGLWVAGGSWAGDIEGGGFRGEVLVSQRPKVLVSGLYDQSDPYGMMVSAAVSGDYTFPSSLYCHFESLYNSIGVTERAALFAPQARLLRLLSPARWSMCGEVSYDITALIRGSVIALHNPSDGSGVFVPSVSWSVVTNLDLTAIALLFHGDGLTEFGGNGESGYLRLKWSF